MHWKSQLIEVATGVKFGFKLIQEMQIYIHLGESSTAGIYILLQLSMSIFLKIELIFCQILVILMIHNMKQIQQMQIHIHLGESSKVRIYLSIYMLAFV